MTLKNLLFVINGLLIIMIVVLYISDKSSLKNDEKAFQDIQIKYSDAQKYISFIPELYVFENQKFKNYSLYSLEGDTVGDISKFYNSKKMFLYISYLQCEECVSYSLSSLHKINEIFGKNNCIVLYEGFSSKSLYLWKNKNEITNDFYEIKNIRPNSSEDETLSARPLLFFLTEDGFLKYPFPPEKIFQETFESYLYTMADIMN